MTDLHKLYPLAVARWESKSGKYFAELRKDTHGYAFIARHAGGSLGQLSNDEHAIQIMERQLEYYAPDGAKRLERVI